MTNVTYLDMAEIHEHPRVPAEVRQISVLVSRAPAKQTKIQVTSEAKQSPKHTTNS